MCGITGFWDSRDFAAAETTIHAMTDRIAHRGPDSCGYWLDREAGVALGHRRLSIIDLSPAGHQPMVSRDERYVLSYNGEIYNHLDLRTSLESEAPQSWRGHSDTETLLAAVSAWGLAATLERLNGMFAFALWDRRERLLYLARDRLGEKPLYYGHGEGAFLFASELKALRRFPRWQWEIDRGALALFLRNAYVPAPHSIYRGIAKLPAAHYLVVGDDGRKVSAPVCYWNLAERTAAGQDNRFAGSDEDAITALDDLLADSVKMRMAADVPLGAFLSGGYDSTTVVALMQAQSIRPVKTFTIGFAEQQFDEAVHARQVAAHLGTEHTELYLSPQDALATIPELPRYWDEPFADPSQIPTLLVSRLARQHVTVSLSGDGGDELFCGYKRYGLARDIWRWLAPLPTPVRKLAAAALRAGATGAPFGRVRDRFLKLAETLDVGSRNAFLRGFYSQIQRPAELVLGASEPATIFDTPSAAMQGELREAMMYIDAMCYLPDDILVKLDRASMAVSLESRVPLLDHRIVEFAAALPLGMKVRGGQSKWILRQVLHRYVPAAMMDRPKQGFSVPIEFWLAGPLRDWAEDLLSTERLAQGGLFAVAPVRQMWEQHRSGQRRWHTQLWSILMAQAWLDCDAR